MKRILVVLALWLLNFIAPNAFAGGGYPELYSWKDGDQWCFSVKFGTNRHKTLDEVKNPRGKMNLDQLIQKLSVDPDRSKQFSMDDSEIVWAQHVGLGLKKDQCDLSVPPADIVAKLKAVVAEHHRKLVFWDESLDPANKKKH